MIKISEKGKELIRNSEGIRYESYLCPAKVWTIGFGHTAGVRKGMFITKEQADMYLNEDLLPIESWLTLADLGLNQSQYDAIASFCFNLGINAFSKSTLLRRIKEGNREEIEKQFRLWVHVGDTVLPGLVKRREAEIELFFSE